MKDTKRILILVSKRPKNLKGMNWNGLKHEVEELLGKGYSVEISALDGLVYKLGRRFAVYDPAKNYDLADFDLVIIRTAGEEVERAIATAHYLEAHNIPFTDSYLLTQGRGKLSCSFARVANGLPVPQTIYAAPDLLPEALKQAKLKYPFILKADLGKKGNDNYLINSESELKSTLANCSNRKVSMIAQQFIPNDGDYRILVLGGEPKFAFFREKNPNTHLNNTSKGGKARKVNLSEIDTKILDDAKRAAEIERLEVAGIDVVIDNSTNQHYFFEVNRAPQIPTGAFTSEKMAAYADMIKEYLKGTQWKKRGTTKAPSKIGRAERIDLPDLRIHAIPAKVDTGADVSSIWASKINEEKDGLHCVFFGPTSPYYNGEEHIFKDSYGVTRIANSFGQKELRYKIKLRVRINGRLINATFTLSDRSQKTYPVLLGRKLLNRKFLVDVSRGKPLVKQEVIRKQKLEIELSNYLQKNRKL